MNRRNWLYLPLLTAGFVLAILFGIAQAAVLKDIRFGEHENFIRIVFVFDSPAELEQIQPMPDGQLTVVFADTAASLVRKIPIETSLQVKNVQVWHRNNALSTILSFNFSNFNHETFALKEPSRIVLDIHPLPASVPPTASIGSGFQENNKDPLMESNEAPAVSTATAAPGSEAEKRSHFENKRPVAAPSVSEPDHAAKQQADPAAEPSDNRLPSYTVVNSSQPPQSKSNRLQFALVIALVLITMVILVFLLLVLLSRNRWVEDKSQLNTKEFLQKQDEHIASLNARIEEQFKRYEEA